MKEPTQLSEQQVKDLCKAGKGEATCSFLTMGGSGMCCSKGSVFEAVIRERRPTMRAKGDNCSGPPDFKPNPNPMKQTTQVSFACKQAGCTGVVTDKPEFVVTLHVGCHASAPAVFCPICGRLYWPENSLPCRNRQHDDGFIVNGGLENRPMPAVEKKAFVKEYIDSVKPDSKEDEVGYVRDNLTYLIEKDHAPGCTAKDDKGECTCGNSDAEKWIVAHPGKEVALAE
jgi:hypothetical protein